MFKFLRTHRTIILLSVAAVFIGLLFFGVGTTSFSSSPQDTIAKVNGKSITQFQFDRLYRQISRQRADMTPEERKGLVQNVFNELIRQEVFSQEAKRYGIFVSDQELQFSIQSIPSFQREGQFSQAIYYQTLAQVFGLTPQQFEDQRRKDLAGQKLNQIIAMSVHVGESEFNRAMQNRLDLTADAKERKELKENPDKIRDEIRQEKINLVFADWLGQLNAGLNVNIVSETFRKQLSGQS